jgi:hypothetical protein
MKAHRRTREAVKIPFSKTKSMAIRWSCGCSRNVEVHGSFKGSTAPRNSTGSMLRDDFSIVLPCMPAAGCVDVNGTDNRIWRIELERTG